MNDGLFIPNYTDDELKSMTVEELNMVAADYAEVGKEIARQTTRLYGHYAAMLERISRGKLH